MSELSDEEIRNRGLEAVLRELGPDGLIRFIRQFSGGSGDYSKERHDWIDEWTLESILEDLRKRENAKS